MDSEPLISGGRRGRLRGAGFFSQGPAEGASIEITFPAEMHSLEILRSVIGRASQMAGFSYDGIEDFAMAVDEAATLLIETCPRDLVLSVVTSLGPAERMEVLLSAIEPTKSLCPAELRADYRWDVLESLCEDVWWKDVGTSIGLSQSTR